MQPYSYELPAQRIAQRPVYPYDNARMLVVDRGNGELKVDHYSNFAHYVRPGDLIVFNQSRVIPARFWGRFLAPERAESPELELLLLRRASLPEADSERWWCIGRPMKRMRPGMQIVFADGRLQGLIESRVEDQVVVQFTAHDAQTQVGVLVEQLGSMPIPPYIRNGISDESDRVDYQTIFATNAEFNSSDIVPGSIAAPTASLHFTAEVIDRIKAVGCAVRFITLHVGLPSIRAVDQILGPGREIYQHDAHLITEIKRVRAAGGRVVAVGTTVVRALESMIRSEGSHGEQAETNLFISPGFQFQSLDLMVTNFHQPGSSHLLLVESILGRELLSRAYTFALENEFRFLSYGDGMLIVGEPNA